ncbi:MAG: hypothetical protein ACLPKB_24755 [Xanthobacteraceae bacterium]
MTTIWQPSSALSLQGGATSGYSFRNEHTSLQGGGDYVRVTFQAGATSGFGASNCSIAKCNSATFPNSDATPVTLLFSGAAGFSIGQNTSITSDWLPFRMVSTDKLVTVIDTNSGADAENNITNGNGDYKASSTTYNQATVSGFTVGNNYCRSVNLIEAYTPLLSGFDSSELSVQKTIMVPYQGKSAIVFPKQDLIKSPKLWVLPKARISSLVICTYDD